MLVPICEFNVTVTDKSGSAIAVISDEPAHKLFSLTLEEIYDIRFVKKQLFPFDNVHKQLSGKTFRIQLKKLSSGKLFILAYEEKEHAQLLVPTSTMVNVVEGSKRKFDDVEQGTVKVRIQQPKIIPHAIIKTKWKREVLRRNIKS